MNCNKICSSSDWNDQALFSMLNDIHCTCLDRRRKDWEWAIGMLAFKNAGKLDNNCTFLGIGSGSEYPIFYLTNHGRYVFATDLYSSSGKWSKYNAKLGMLSNPDDYYPHKYNKNRLGVQIMSGTDLRFEDNTIDGIFTYSSIEHFGGKDNAKKCIQEIERVLKPNGIASIATELYVGNVDELAEARKKYSAFPINLFNRYTIFNEMFTQEELEKYIINSTNLKLTSSIDYNVKQSDIENAIVYPVTKHTGDHLFLNLSGIIWGSVHLTLTKEEET